MLDQPPRNRLGTCFKWTLFAAVWMTAGCAKLQSVDCGDLVCPAESRCDIANHRCVTPAQQIACAGIAEYGACNLAGAPGLCRSNACEPFFCGDHISTGLELCDTTPPTGQSCLEFGYDRGFLGCSTICGPALEGCGYLAWSPILPNAPTLFGVWGTSRDDLFAVGMEAVTVGNEASWHGVIVHWDGASWSKTTSDIRGSFRALGGSGPNDVFAVGDEENTRPAVQHWNGNTWSRISPPAAGQTLSAVWASGPRDVFVGGAGVFKWDGTEWTDLQAPLSTVLGLWGTGPDDVLAVGNGDIAHWNGATWTTELRDDSLYIRSVWGSGPNDVFAAEGDGILHWDGTSWSYVHNETDLISIWGSGPSDVFVVGNEKVIHWDGTSWIPLLTRFGSFFEGVWGTGPDNAYAVGDLGFIHLTGSSWSSASTPAPTSVAAPIHLASWQSEAGDLYAVGIDAGPGVPDRSGILEHWDGTRWERIDVGFTPPLWGVWGTRSGELFAVGDRGAIVHGTGPTAPVRPSPTGTNLRGVWGSGPDDVFASGDDGTILHWDGATWQQMTSGVNVALAGIWGNGPGNVFVVGDEGVIVHWNGASWSPMQSGTSWMLWDIWGSASDDVYAVGEVGTILHWDGARWSTLPSGTTGYLSHVDGSSASDVFVAGAGLLHARAGFWEPIGLSSATTHSTSPAGLHVTPSTVTLLEQDRTINWLHRPSVSCVGPELDCDDGWDNDCDGRVDGADPDCNRSNVRELCADLADNDYDGLVDCADPDCRTYPACGR